MFTAYMVGIMTTSVANVLVTMVSPRADGGGGLDFMLLAFSVWCKPPSPACWQCSAVGCFSMSGIALPGLLEVMFGRLLAWWDAGRRPGPAVLTGGTLVIGALVFNGL